MSQMLLGCGVNDLGGTLMNESISTAAGVLSSFSKLSRLAHFNFIFLIIVFQSFSTLFFFSLSLNLSITIFIHFI